MKRRQMIKTAAVTFAGLAVLNHSRGLGVINSWDRAKDESFWRSFRDDNYDISDSFINLENGYFGVQPKSVIQAYHENVDRVNRFSSKYMRQDFYEEKAEIMKLLADFSGVEPEELLLTRNATEALNILIQGVPLAEGDEVLLQYHDYHSMIETFQMLEQTRGIKLKFVDVPLVPKSPEEVIELYKAAMGDRTRCILLTHLTHLTGQIIPVTQIAQIAKARGIEVIVDAAHSFAQLDYKIPELNADFVGVNLHKWFSNPLGAGLLYVRKDRIKDVKPLFGDQRHTVDDIGKLGHYGTPATPIVMTLKTAHAFNQSITIPLKESRVRYLQQYWTSVARSMDRVEVVTPYGASQSCGLASFKINGVPAEEVVRVLDQRHKVFTVIRKLHDQTVVRVTPNLYNTIDDLERLLEGIRSISRA